MSYVLRPQQVVFEEAIRDAYRRGVRSVLAVAPTGFGKCLGEGTPVMLHGGRVVPVECIRVGNRLMGADGMPRRVVATTAGNDELYRINPVKGESFVCNGAHILCLRISGKGKFARHKRNAIGCVEISVDHYMKENNYFKHCGKLLRVPIEFGMHPGYVQRTMLDIDPYFLGVWLGDGSSRHPSITTEDAEVVVFLHRYVTELGLFIRDDTKKNCPTYFLTSGKRDRTANPLTTAMRRRKLLGNKHIPLDYKTAPRRDRLRLLAGLVDSDGYVFKNNIEIVTKFPQLADDILFLARSLGFAAYSKRVTKTNTVTGISGEYTLVAIFGAKMDEIPVLLKRKRCTPRQQKKDAMVDGIASIEAMGAGKYYGFELDGDGLFLLGDFTVAHNSVVIADMGFKAAEKGREVLIVTNRRQIVMQLQEHCYNAGIAAGIIMGNIERDEEAKIQIASIQTLKRRSLKWMVDPNFIIIDEAHQEYNAYRKLIREQFPAIPILGMTATPVGPGGARIGHFDDHVEPVRNSEVIAAGDLLKVHPYLAPSEPDMGGIDIKKASQDDIGQRVDECTIYGDVFKEWEPYRHMQTMVVLPSRAVCQGFLRQCLGRGITAKIVDGTTEQSEREDTFSEFKETDCQMLLGVDVIREGLDLPIAQCLIDLQPTHQFRRYWQTIGRVKRPHPVQESAVIIDLAGNLLRHMVHPDHDPPWNEITNDMTIEEVIERKAGVRCPECGSRDIYSVKDFGYKCEDCGHQWHTKKPWVCPSCKQALAPWQKVIGGTCPNCGVKVGTKPVRTIRMQDGTLRTWPADEIKRRKKSKANKEQAIWDKFRYIAHHSKRTLDFARVLYKKEMGEWPSELKNCPDTANSGDWKRKPSDVYPWMAGKK